jgi:hypothetical protein
VRPKPDEDNDRLDPPKENEFKSPFAPHDKAHEVLPKLLNII